MKFSLKSRKTERSTGLILQITRLSRDLRNTVIQKRVGQIVSARKNVPFVSL